MLYLSDVTALLNYVTFLAKDHGCYLCRCLDICFLILVALRERHMSGHC